MSHLPLPERYGRVSSAINAVAGAAMLLCATSLFAQEKVVFATNWKAQAAQGGFYQALADGTYKKYGLDVEIIQGGPMVNNRPLLPAGKIDFLMTGNLLHSFDNLKNKVPTVAVMSAFQKDPQAMFAHPGQGYNSFKDLAKAPVALIGKDGQFSFWQWMKSEYGFKDEQLKPYTYNIGPFLADKKSVQQGYAIEEPLTIKAKAGFDPLVFLLADNGFSTYSTTVETRVDMVRSKPQLVQKFVDASILGWNNYLYGNNQAANELIKKANPDMSDANIAGSIVLMKQMGIVDSGDAQTQGIGAMSEARVKDFFEKMVKAGLYKAGEIDPAQAITTQFVNKGVGVELRKQLTGK